MKKYDIVLLTDYRYVTPKVITPYIENILLEDLFLLKAIEENGINAVRVDWADEHFDWSSAKIAVFRTTWDYFDRFDEFINWLNRTKNLVNFINPIETILWNIDKHYLKDLEDRGIRIPETKFIEVGDDINLSEFMASAGWHDAILKPAISASANHTYRINAENCAEIEPLFQSLIKNDAMLIQPFQKSVVEKGEVALMYIDGKYSHAVLKVAKKEDFRVQEDFGGTVHDYTPTEIEINLGKQTLQACNSIAVYARVDIIEDNYGNSVVSELELIEPELWFRQKPSAAVLFANVLAKLL